MAWNGMPRQLNSNGAGHPAALDLKMERNGSNRNCNERYTRRWCDPPTIRPGIASN
uniref:Uncharacterized protein n=1 Tax=Arundo donax TaxID=35708 RepID=A0A0A9FD33_ARUDO